MKVAAFVVLAVSLVSIVEGVAPEGAAERASQATSIAAATPGPVPSLELTERLAAEAASLVRRIVTSAIQFVEAPSPPAGHSRNTAS